MNLALALLCAGCFYAVPPSQWLDAVCMLTLFLFAGVAWGLYRRAKFTLLLALFATVAGTILFVGTEEIGLPHRTDGLSFAAAFLVYFGAMWAVGILSMYRGFLYFNKRRVRSRRSTRSEHSPVRMVGAGRGDGSGRRLRRIIWRMTTDLNFRTARDIRDKARRERHRYADALDRKDLTAAADHLFNLATTILAVRDWVIESAPAHESAARRLLKDEQAVARLVDAANIGKHGGKLDPDRKGYSTAEIINQSVTAVPVMGAAWYEGPFGDPPDEAKDVVVAPQTELVMRTKSMHADGTRHFQLDDADAAIAAWEKFLADRGL